MKIVKLYIENFRGFKSIEVEFDEKFNVIVGKNDVGKSTILESLEIFFNNSTVKIDTEDLCKFSDKDYIEIGISFKLENFELRIDTAPTFLDKEYLLDEHGLLNVVKRWDCSKKSITKASEQIFIRANYPKGFEEPLIVLKNTDLKSKITNIFGDNLPEDVKKNTNSTMRLALYEHYNNLSNFDLEPILIELNKEDAKKVWMNLQKDIPLFFLFQSDRANKDSDKEVQDPLKAITKLAISEVQDDLERVISRIESLVTQVAQDTVDKMQEMDPNLAESLKPNLSQKNWDSLFSFTFIGDDDVPINKRGSGFRRLLLLNYFRAEAERANESRRPIIYAIEEPETALHPNWQLMLINSLLELSENNNTQIFITTHSPALASTVSYDYIRFIKKESDAHYVRSGSNTSLDEVCDTLGIMPTIPSSNDLREVKVILCLEGINDVKFFYNISNLFDIDLENDYRILVIPLGGGTLIEWVNKSYLDKLTLPQIHIYDNDVAQYQDAIDIINERTDGSIGRLTRMIEIENYIHPCLIKSMYNLDEDYFINNEGWKEEWVDHDVPTELNGFLNNLSNLQNIDIPNRGSSKIKKKFADEGSSLMTIELLQDLNAFEEVNEWFDRIKEFL